MTYLYVNQQTRTLALGGSTGVVHCVPLQAGKRSQRLTQASGGAEARPIQETLRSDIWRAIPSFYTFSEQACILRILFQSRASCYVDLKRRMCDPQAPGPGPPRSTGGRAPLPSRPVSPSGSRPARSSLDLQAVADALLSCLERHLCVPPPPPDPAPLGRATLPSFSPRERGSPGHA